MEQNMNNDTNQNMDNSKETEKRINVKLIEQRIDSDKKLMHVRFNVWVLANYYLKFPYKKLNKRFKHDTDEEEKKNRSRKSVFEFLDISKTKYYNIVNYYNSVFWTASFEKYSNMFGIDKKFFTPLEDKKVKKIIGNADEWSKYLLIPQYEGKLRTKQVDIKLVEKFFKQRCEKQEINLEDDAYDKILEKIVEAGEDEEKNESLKGVYKYLVYGDSGYDEVREDITNAINILDKMNKSEWLNFYAITRKEKDCIKIKKCLEVIEKTHDLVKAISILGEQD